MPAAGSEFTLTRIADAPRQLVWDAWTQEKHLRQWFGPKDGRLAVCDMDLRVGGIFHYAFELPGGKMMWGKWTFREIVAPERLAVVVSFSDEQRGVTRHPFAPGWPLETLSTTTFTEEGGKTRIDLVWDAINATPEEVTLFANSHAGMNQGWNGMYEQLAEYLANAQA